MESMKSSWELDGGEQLSLNRSEGDLVGSKTSGALEQEWIHVMRLENSKQDFDFGQKIRESIL